MSHSSEPILKKFVNFTEFSSIFEYFIFFSLCIY